MAKTVLGATITYCQGQASLQITECPKSYRKPVLHLLKYT